jgi:poly(3-hydroxybutyrate) depolymerase
MALAMSLSEASFAADRLKSHTIDASRITVSGVSSGGYMAAQIHLAHSKLFSGASSVAGGLFWCAQGSSTKAQMECMGQPAQQDVQASVREAKRQESLGLIDPLTGLSGDRVYVYASPKDSIIRSGNSQNLSAFYQAIDQSLSSPTAPPLQLKTEISGDAAHGFPTLSYGAPCKIGFSPWLLNCGLDLAGDILKNLDPQVTSVARGVASSSSLFEFDQTEFGDSSTPLFPTGWLYVPARCQNGAKCGLHLALHGCQMNPDFIQDQFARHAGYNEWAESADLIILYPQSAKIPNKNPYACWDWFGFTGPDYTTKNAPQIQALKAMVDRVRGLR